MGTERNGSFVEREDAENDDEANEEEHRTQKALINSGPIASDPASAGETMAMALRSSRARALRTWKLKP
jgi:hypothetical protein